MCMIKRIVMAPYNILNNIYLDCKAKKNLRHNSQKMHASNKPMKVGFVVFEPETWDKLAPVYNELLSRGNIVVRIIIVPSFDQELKLTTKYGKELSYFRNIDSNSILAYEGGWIDIRKDGYDYIFYQDPYNIHMPPLLRSDYVVRFAKICYVPYGMVGSDVFINNNINKDFFRNVYCEFVDISEIQRILLKKYKRNVKKGYQHFLLIGYPALMRYFNYEFRDNYTNILWTPRWSCHPVLGGSNFFEYKDCYLKLAKNYPELSCRIRPHPMLFENFIKEGLLSELDCINYRKMAEKCKVEISEGNDLDKDFYDTDILITDFSSIIPQFFMTKRPIIYCTSHIRFNSFYQGLSKGMYIANTWKDVEDYIKMLKEGNDYLYNIRLEIVNKLSSEHIDSEKKIVDYLVNDYNKKSK